MSYSVYYFSVTCTDLHNFESRLVSLAKSLSKMEALEYREICNEISKCYEYNCKTKNSIRNAHYFFTNKPYSSFKYFTLEEDGMLWNNLGPLPEDFIIKTFKKAIIVDDKDEEDLEYYISVDKEYGFYLVDSGEVKSTKYTRYIEIIQKLNYEYNNYPLLKKALIKQFSYDVLEK